MEDARIRALRAAVSIAPEDAGLRRLLADALLSDGSAEEAVGEFRACLRLAPDDPAVLLGLARAYRAAGKRSAALLALDDLAGRAGDLAEAELLRARLLAEAGDVTGAVAAYERAVQANPLVEDAELAARLGELLSGAGSGGDSGAGRSPDRPLDHETGRTPGAGSTVDPARPVPDDPRDREASAPRARVPAMGPRQGDTDDDGVEVDRATEVERPRISFVHVGGMDAVKDEIRSKIIDPLDNPELFRAYGKAVGGGILMYGPPGCGKTHLARATAGEVRAGFLSVGISDVLTMWLGESERNLHALFATARREQPCVLFFDEVEALGGSRGDFRGSAGRTVVNQFLAEMDGVNASNEGVLILGATNAPWHLDSAFRRPGRFDRVIFVPPPDQRARAAILRVLLDGKPVGDVDHDAVAKKTDGFSGADMKGVVDLAIEEKLRRAVRDRIPRPIETGDLLGAVKHVVPSTREWFATARNYVLYANEAGLYDAVRPWVKL